MKCQKDKIMSEGAPRGYNTKVKLTHEESKYLILSLFLISKVIFGLKMILSLKGTSKNVNSFNIFSTGEKYKRKFF